MDFEKPLGYVAALKKLEGFPLMGVEVRDGHLFFTSLSRRISLPLRKTKDWGYKVARYSVNKLDALVDCVEYNDQFRQVRLLDENGDVIACVTLKKYVRLADGVVFTEEADGLGGVFVQWRFLDSPVDRINDWGNKVSIMAEEGAAVEILFRKEDGDD